MNDINVTHRYYENDTQILSQTETIELLYKIRSGDEVARQKLITHNIRFVKSIALKFDYDEDTKDDLISEGIIGLIKAIDNFDISKNVYFLTYSNICIKNEILLFLNKTQREKKHDRLNEEIKIDENDIKYEKMDIIMDPYDIEEEYCDRDYKKYVCQTISKLPNQAQNLIKLNFGLYGRAYSQKEIATIYGYTQGYVSKLLNKAIKQLRDELKEDIPQKIKTISKQINNKI